jgi:hypothetical protein
LVGEEGGEEIDDARLDVDRHLDRIHAPLVASGNLKGKPRFHLT